MNEDVNMLPVPKLRGKSPLETVAELTDAEVRELLAGAIAQETILTKETALLERYEKEADENIKDITDSHVRLLLLLILNEGKRPSSALEFYRGVMAEEKLREEDAKKWGLTGDV